MPASIAPNDFPGRRNGQRIVWEYSTQHTRRERTQGKRWNFLQSKCHVRKTSSYPASQCVNLWSGLCIFHPITLGSAAIFLAAEGSQLALLRRKSRKILLTALGSQAYNSCLLGREPYKTTLACFPMQTAIPRGQGAPTLCCPNH
jgi:hypothetical protein